MYADEGSAALEDAFREGSHDGLPRESNACRFELAMKRRTAED
jgi:hypothetical protein